VGHYYFDSSALIKRYVVETGTTWVNNLCHVSQEHTLYVVRISGAELIAALFRRVRNGDIALADGQAAATQFKADFRNNYQVVEVTEHLIDSAMILAEKNSLRGYDSVQLAGAMALQSIRTTLSLSPLTFVCADNYLNTVAATEGLVVENPNNY
jgi:hypothetical protein